MWSSLTKATMKIAGLLLMLCAAASANECTPDNCFPPDCQCFSTESPLRNTSITKIPQIVVLSFDDAVTVSNYPFYDYLLYNQNPNTCPISLTFFISHKYTDYTLVNELHRRGNEIAVHSVTHKHDVEHYWRKANYSVWKSEMEDARDMLIKYGYIPKEDIKGFRAPFLELGGDAMFEALHDSGFKYDSSWASLQYTNWYSHNGEPPKGAAFPFTMDFGSKLDQQIGTVPLNSYPGLWVAPMLDLKDDRGEACAMLDACQSNMEDCPDNSCENIVFDFLKKNFNNNYYNNRAPFGLYTHQSWFKLDEIGETSARTNAYNRFLQYIASLEDVWIVSLDRLIEWMKSPKSTEDIMNFEPFRCNSLPESTCPDTTNCNYTIGAETVYTNICSLRCPNSYPWLGNVNGN